MDIIKEIKEDAQILYTKKDVIEILQRQLQREGIQRNGEFSEFVRGDGGCGMCKFKSGCNTECDVFADLADGYFK